MIIKWKAVSTNWQTEDDGGDGCQLTEGFGQFELPEGAQLLGYTSLHDGRWVLVTWVELTPAERIERMRATQSGRVIT